jgi:hypothetical protein
MITRARLEMVNANNKIVFGRSMWGYCELSDLIVEFFRIMPDYVDQSKCNLKVTDVSH